MFAKVVVRLCGQHSEVQGLNMSCWRNEFARNCIISLRLTVTEEFNTDQYSINHLVWSHSHETSSSLFYKRQRNQRSNCQYPLDHRKTKRVSEKHIFLFYWLCPSLLLVDHNKRWKILKEMGIPDHLTCLLRNLYAGQEATVRTGHGTTDWFQIGKGLCKAVHCHPTYLAYMKSTS